MSNRLFGTATLSGGPATYTVDGQTFRANVPTPVTTERVWVAVSRNSLFRCAVSPQGDKPTIINPPRPSASAASPTPPDAEEPTEPAPEEEEAEPVTESRAKAKGTKDKKTGKKGR